MPELHPWFGGLMLPVGNQLDIFFDSKIKSPLEHYQLGI